MAAKRKQDERHLKILRELGALLHNKQCFDCNQRGPTYLNMTIGSFTCTSCSGILRGLNPPHRVKSISMASFTSDEIEFVRSRGNEYCRREWLATYDGTPPIDSESKDEQRVKDFLAMKYERKRWYAPPGAAATQSLQSPSVSTQSFTSPSAVVNAPPNSSATSASLPEQRPVANNVRPLGVHNNQSQVSRPMMQSASFPPAQTRTGMDLLGDLGGDPFAASASANSTMNNANFANFDNFLPGPSSPRRLAPPSSGSSTAPLNSNGGGALFSGASGQQQQQQHHHVPGAPHLASSSQAYSPRPSASSPPAAAPSLPQQSQQQQQQQPPTKDRYAALADLDCFFNTSSTVPSNAQSAPVDWQGTGSAGSNSWPINGSSPALFNAATSSPVAYNTVSSPSNPFTGAAVPTPTWNKQPSAATTPSPGNPFASAGLQSPPNNLANNRAASPAEQHFYAGGGGGGYGNAGMTSASSYSSGLVQQAGPQQHPSHSVSGNANVWGASVGAVPTPFAQAITTNGNYPGYKMAVQSPFANWQPSPVGNPFASGVNTTPPKPSSSNPFL